MKKLIKFLWKELIIDPIRGAYNITQILMNKQDPPEWLTTKWDMKEIFKQSWILWLCCILMFSVGWLSASTMHNQQIVVEAEKLACELFNTDNINTKMRCSNYTSLSAHYTKPLPFNISEIVLD